MPGKRGDASHIVSSEPALRVIMRGLRAIMAEPADGQTRLNRIVRQIAGVMVAEVCSIYLKRQDGSLELFATEGLNASAVHSTRLARGEGLVGRCAELDITINEPDAPNHPSFSYRPETSEEIFHAMLAVPIKRSGEVLGVLVVQNRAAKLYSEEDIEVLETTAMVIAENLVTGAVAGSGAAIEITKSQSARRLGEPISEGIALGHAFLHEPRIVVTKLMADEPALEMRRLDAAMAELRTSLDEIFAHEHLPADGEHRDVFEVFRMFARDRGWEDRLRAAIQGGLTAEAAVESIQNNARRRMSRPDDPYWRERQRDFGDLSDRLLRILAGRRANDPKDLPPHTILVARTMGPAELIDYDRSKLRGLIVEDGGRQSHVAIVAKALGIPALGQVRGLVERVGPGDAVILDADAGEVYLRPSSDVVAAYSDKVRFRARRQRKYRALRDRPAVTKDGRRISLQMNAGLLVDMPHLAESGADGVGLFRTELLFMMSQTLPRLTRQTRAYREILAEAKGKPVVFRALDIGGDKILPYLRQTEEENPAMGWRAIRMSLDRPALFRTQIRALLMAAAGGELRVMIPMVSTAAEMVAIKALIAREHDLLRERGYGRPSRVLVGAMFEVPSLLFELDQFLPEVDFVSVGSNDLFQFLFAADRLNPLVADRYDPLSGAPLRALKLLLQRARAHRVPVTFCGEMAGRPLEAMALIGLGFRSISMAPASIGPVKAMILSLNAKRLSRRVGDLLRSGKGCIREELAHFAVAEGADV